MGTRKRNSAEKIKEAKKDLAFAKLNNCPTSPRKMRLVADQIRGEGISSALSILKFKMSFKDQFFTISLAASKVSSSYSIPVHNAGSAHSDL